jgi:hypothetical protein
MQSNKYRFYYQLFLMEGIHLSNMGVFNEILHFIRKNKLLSCLLVVAIFLIIAFLWYTFHLVQLVISPIPFDLNLNQSPEIFIGKFVEKIKDVVVTTAIVAVIFIFLTIVLRIISSISQKEEDLSERTRELEEKMETLSLKQTGYRNKKNEVLKKKIKSFYYLNKEMIKALYYQRGDIHEPKGIKERKRVKHAADLRSHLSAFFGGVTGKTSEESIDETEKIYDKAHLTEEKMYNEVEELLIKNNQVIFNLEDVDSPLWLNEINTENSLQQATRFVQKYSSKSEEEMNKKIKELLERDPKEFEKFIKMLVGTPIANDKIREISQATGYIIIFGQFTVDPIAAGSGYTLLLDHPLNDYLFDSEIRVKFQINCNIAHFSNVGFEVVHELRKPIMGYCFATITSWNDKTKTMELSPYAIYS